MADDNVAPNNGAQPEPRDQAVPAGAAKPEKPTDELKQMREELAQLRRTNEQLAASERFWAQRAAAAGHAADEPEPEEQVDDFSDVLPDDDTPGAEDDSPDKFVDDLSASGIKALEKRGVLTKKEAAKMIAEISAKVASRIVAKTTRQIQTDADLFTEFPELKDESSPLFQETGKEYRALVAMDPALKKSPAALLMAARVAKAKLAPSRQDDAERRRRIEAQSGEPGRRPAHDGFEEDDDTLSPRQRAIIAAMGIKEDDYVAAAKKGINVSSRGRRR